MKRLIIFLPYFIIVAVAAALIAVPVSDGVPTGSFEATVIIDAGHGGFDGGAVAPDGTLEKDINLAIALFLEESLNERGVKTVMTRVSDVSTCDDGLSSIREKKSSDLKNRLELINSTPNAVFVSVHQNYFEDSSVKGAQMFFSPNNRDSERLALLIQRSFTQRLEPDNKRQIKDGSQSVYLLRSARVPAVLVECGFISNPEQLALLKDGEYRKSAAQAICEGIIAFITSPEEISTG